MEKKLIIFIPSIESGGVEKNLFIISNYLIKKFKIIYLVTTDYKYKNKFDKKIKLILPKSKYWINKKRIYKYFISLLLLLKIIFKEKNFLIFSFQANLYAIILAKIFFKKVIIRVNSSPSGWVNNYFKLLIYKIFYKLSDEIIVNSKELQNEFLEYFQIKTKIIYNPLNIFTIKKSIKSKLNLSFFKKNYLNLITIGRFVNQKNHLLILKAVKILKDKLPIRLLIIGQGVLLNEYKKFISKNNLKNEISIINYQKNPYKFINQANIFILSSFYEGLPNVLLEAQYLKKIIISSNCPTGTKEILLNGRAGFLFKNNDLNDLCKKIIYVSKNKQIANFKVKYAYEKINRFNYSKNLLAYYKTIYRVINGQKFN
jgi:glycosyltransferase involved in cell wall biosynthesis